MSDHGSPEGSNLPVDEVVDEGSGNEELENAELENNNWRAMQDAWHNNLYNLS